ncbi:DUF5665 domain-containing protein [Primorskyibacter sp. 2E233]|uniref:DUF5665 domain-containing protein n=1 Tax=Primorskyibacter sp. 2E233 TaxID=3413431 RepID=UPI003BF173EA
MQVPEPNRSEQLHGDLNRLADEVARLNNHRFIKVQNSLYRLVAFQFIRGLAFGLGTVVGASALVSVIVLLLSQVAFVPILGDLASQIIEEIQPPEAETTR